MRARAHLVDVRGEVRLHDAQELVEVDDVAVRAEVVLNARDASRVEVGHELQRDLLVLLLLSPVRLPRVLLGRELRIEVRHGPATHHGAKETSKAALFA